MPTATAPTYETPSQYIPYDDATNVKASYATADTPESPLFSESVKPEALEKIEDALIGPKDGFADVEAAQVVEHVGFMKYDLGLDFGWGPSSLIQYTLEHMHITLGLSWAATILATGLLARLAIVRLIYKQQHQVAKLQEVEPIMTPLKEQYRDAVARGDKREYMEIANQMRAVKGVTGFSVITMFAPVLIQVPLTFGGFRVLRNAAELPVPSMENESFLWIADLTVSDPWILPAIVGAMTWRAISRMSATQTTPQNESMMAVLKWILPGLSVTFCHFQPLAVQLWFLTTSAFAYIQSEFLRSAKARAFVGLPPPPKPKPGAEPVDAFGYRFQKEVGGMRMQNGPSVLDAQARVINQATGAPPGPAQNISIIDKAYNKVKSAIASSDAQKNLDRRNVEKKRKFEEREQERVRQVEVDHERQFRQDRESRSREIPGTGMRMKDRN